MSSNNLRNESWYEFHNAERLCRYYEALTKKYRERHNRITKAIGILAVVSGFLASASAIPTVKDSPYLFWVALAGGISGVVTLATAFASLALGDANKSAIAHITYTKCSKLRYEYKLLWFEVENGTISDDTISERLEKLHVEIDEVDAIAGYSGIILDDKENEKAFDKTDEILTQQYQSNGAMVEN